MTLTCLTELPNHTILGGTQLGKIYRTTDDGITWTESDTGLTAVYVTTMASVAPRVAFAGTRGNGLFRSTDNGVSWQPANTGLGTLTIGSVRAGQGGAVYAVGGEWTESGGTGGAFRSTDLGASWVRVDTGLSNSWLISVGISPATGTVVVGSPAGPYFRSTDRGNSWTELHLIQGWAGFCIETMSNGWFFAGSTGNGVYRSTDDGVNWTLTPTGFVNSLCFNGLGYVFKGLANNEGLEVSKDSGKTYLNDLGLGRWSVNALLCTATGHVIAGTNVGILRTAESTTSIRLEGGGDPSPFALNQNYPNPFNPSTTIRFSLARRTSISLSVFNLLGQKVAELVNGQVEAGGHAVRFDAAGLPSGVYLYRLQAGAAVAARSMVVIK